MCGDDDDDLLYGGTGLDFFWGSSGTDTANGEDGDDICSAETELSCTHTDYPPTSCPADALPY